MHKTNEKERLRQENLRQENIYLAKRVTSVIVYVISNAIGFVGMIGSLIMVGGLIALLLLAWLAGVMGIETSVVHNTPSDATLKEVESVRSGHAAPNGWRRGEWEIYKANHPNRAEQYLNDMLNRTRKRINFKGLMLPAGIIVGTAFIIYLIFQRIADSKAEKEAKERERREERTRELQEEREQKWREQQEERERQEEAEWG